jgi:hypothetical protein
VAIIATDRTRLPGLFNHGWPLFPVPPNQNLWEPPFDPLILPTALGGAAACATQAYWVSASACTCPRGGPGQMEDTDDGGPEGGRGEAVETGGPSLEPRGAAVGLSLPDTGLGPMARLRPPPLAALGLGLLHHRRPMETPQTPDRLPGRRYCRGPRHRGPGGLSRRRARRIRKPGHLRRLPSGNIEHEIARPCAFAVLTLCPNRGSDLRSGPQDVTDLRRCACGSALAPRGN